MVQRGSSNYGFAGIKIIGTTKYISMKIFNLNIII